jgi:hypothetical protein
MGVPTDGPRALPRYERPPEAPDGAAAGNPVPWSEAATAVAGSPLSAGSKVLALALLRTGTTRVFPGGGVGIEYGSLLKTAVHPADLGGHAAEAAAHLKERRVDLLLVPGMSGYPIGSLYALASGIPAILLKKSRLSAAEAEAFPPGAFVIPSYTGEGDVVMAADPAAVADVVGAVCARQLADQPAADRPSIVLRFAGADDIIDKATMSRAVGESAAAIGTTAASGWLDRHRRLTGEPRPVEIRVEVVAWVTPIIKGYNRPQEHLRRAFGIEAFAGVNVLGLSLDPPALDIEGVGPVAFAPRS